MAVPIDTVQRTISHINADFDSLVEELKAKLEQQPLWAGLTESSTVMALIEAVVFAGLNSQYYAQRTFAENFVATAKFWESLVRLGQLVGYDVRRPRGAIAKLRIHGGSSDVVIPAGTLITINGLDFYFPNTITVPAYSAATPYVETTVRQGTPVVYTVEVTNSQPLLSIPFGNENTSDMDLKVLVDGVEWTRVDRVLLTNYPHSYEVTTIPDKRLEIRFGLEETGVPLSGQVVEIHCYENVGSQGNFFRTDVDFSGKVEGLDAEVIPPVVGGGDLEDTESLRVNIPLHFRLLSGFVAKDDYAKFIANYPGVKKAVAFDIKDSKITPFRTVEVYVLPEGGYEFPDTLKTELEGQIEPLLPAGLELFLYGAVIRDVQLGIGIKVKRGYDSNVVKAEILETLNELYDPDNLEFGQWITRTVLAQTIIKIPGVDRVEIFYPPEDVLTMKPYEFCRLLKVDLAMYS